MGTRSRTRTTLLKEVFIIRLQKNLKDLTTGDIILTNFNPTHGVEKNGKNRPALVITSKEVNNLIKLVSVLPISRQNNGFPTHVKLESKKYKTQGFIQVEHLRTLDLNARGFKYIEKIHPEDLKEVKNIFFSIYEDMIL